MLEVLEKLKKMKVRRIFLQVPEGLMPRVQQMAKEIEKGGFECFICLEKTFGACDLREEEAKRLGCDCILHIGHSDFGIKTSLPVVYWEYFIDADPRNALDKCFDKLQPYKKIGLVANVQFAKLIPKVKSYLESRDKQVFVAKRLQYPGQVLGCRQDAAKAIEKNVDCFLCISAGKFYALGLALSTDKPVLNLDLEREIIENLEEEKAKAIKREAWAKSKLKEAKRVGILISWKRGQLNLCSELKEKLVKDGKEVYVLVADEITPEKIEGLKLDVLINCACPRIAVDDATAYKIPIINVKNI
jgi:2-(3-amino-3-carboxypropyl)histidine synthase